MALAAARPNLESICCMHWNFSSSASLRALTTVTPSLKKLTLIEVWGITPADILLLGEHCPLLEHLHLKCDSDVKCDSDDLLHHDSNPWVALAEHTPNLADVFLDVGFDFDSNNAGDIAVAFASNCSRLKRLELGFEENFPLTDRAMEALASCSELEELTSTDMDWPSDNGIAAIARSASLRYLSVRSSAMTDRSCEMLASMSLTSLDWRSEASQITDAGVAYLRDGLPALVELWLPETELCYSDPKFSAGAVKAFVSARPRVRLNNKHSLERIFSQYEHHGSQVWPGPHR